MPSYVVTGASQGLGFAFLCHLSKIPGNTVVGLVRNKAAAEENLRKAGVEGVFVVEGDVGGEVDELERAAAETAKITGGGLDYLINNAAYVASTSEFKTLADFNTSPRALLTDFLTSFQINALGFVKLTHAFLPLILHSSSGAKKVTNISTGMADLDLINDYGLAIAAPYSVSKAAANAVVAKYNAAYGGEGVLFLSVSPGYVGTERVGVGPREEEDVERAADFGRKLAAYAPGFQGPISPAESVEAVLAVIEKASLEAGNGGEFVSHLGGKQWL
ncbi:MAG: hypothetical protein M1840_009078 [Geoglossum simile]|nr:MAG: hypothetical protein M1840_009078 [Geoglossum simile]